MLIFMILGALVAVGFLSRYQIADVFANLHGDDLMIGIVASIPTFVLSIVIAYRIKQSTESKIAAVPAETIRGMAKESTASAIKAIEKETGHPVPVSVQASAESDVSTALAGSLSAAYGSKTAFGGTNYTLAEELRLSEQYQMRGDTRKLWLAVGEDVAKRSIYHQVAPPVAETTGLFGGDSTSKK